MRQQGKVTKWFEGKGYGFLAVDSQFEQIFAHISAFPKAQRHPVVGEVVTFEIAKDEKKGKQAYNVLYVNRIVSTHNSNYDRKAKKKTNYSIFSLLFFIIFGYLIWTKFNSVENGIASPAEEKFELSEQLNSSKIQKFQCANKTHCSEMISCDEAMFYLQNCPGTLADGDGDGIPCEDQWCGH